MRIVRAKFVNFVHLGDVEFNSDDEIVAFLGKNGSGKSTLLFALNPDPSSDRYVTTYPAIKGLHAYKELVYSDGHITYEVKTEYVPKKDKHSAKCYFNVIDEAGNRKELNPTGHVEFYKDLVNKHLNFNSSVSEVSYIYLNNNGLVTATPKRRKEIAESTIDVKLLKNMQKNAIDGVKETKATKNALNDQLYRAANYIGSVEEAKKKIAEIEKELDLELKKQGELSTDKINAELRLSEIKSNVNVSRKTIEYLFNTITKVNSADFYVKTFKDVQNLVKDISYNFEIEFKDVQNYKEKLTRIEKQAELRETVEGWRSKLSMAEDYKNNLERDITKLMDISKISELKSVSNIINYMFNSNYKNLDVEQNITNQISSIKGEINRLHKFRIEYDVKSKKSNNGFDSTGFTKLSEACNSCPLYNDIVLNKEFVSKNRDRYESSLDEMEELESTLTSLEYYKGNVSDFITSIISIIHKSVLDRLGLSDINSACYNLINNPSYDYEDIFNSLLENIKNHGEQLDIIVMNKRLIDLNPLEDIDLSELETIRDIIAKKTESLNYIVERKQRLLDIVKDFDSVTRFESDYINSSQEDLAKTLYEIDNYTSIKDRFEKRIDYISTKLNESNSKFRDLTNERATLERGIKEYESVSDILKKTNDEFEFYSRSKELLIKRIPLSLLENNLRFMESVTNRILSENNINIQIRIEATATEINIPYIVNDAEVDDIRLCSQGETCLLSLLLNACMVHITGYGIMYLDEIDANLDEVNRKKFNNIIYSILNLLNIKQIFGISHNISSNISSAKKFGLGDISELSIDESEVEFIK